MQSDQLTAARPNRSQGHGAGRLRNLSQSRVSPQFPATKGGDIIMVSSDGVQFYLHKANLAATSHVFNDMLELSTAAGGTVTLEETAEVLEIVLPYVYLDALPYFKLEFPKSFMVLKALDKYGIWRGIEAIKVAFRDRYLGVEGTTADFAQNVYTYLAAVQLQDSRLEKLALMRIVDTEPTVDELRATSARHAGYFKGEECRRLVENFMAYQLRVKQVFERLSLPALELCARHPVAGYGSYKPCEQESTFLKAWARVGRITSRPRLAAYMSSVVVVKCATCSETAGRDCLAKRQAAFAGLLEEVEGVVLSL